MRTTTHLIKMMFVFISMFFLYTKANAQIFKNKKKDVASSADAQSTPELPVDQVTSKVVYKDIIDSTGKTKKELFDKAKKWMTIKNSEVNPYIISQENADDGTIIGRGTFSLPTKGKSYIIKFLINIATKEGKIKYEFTDIVIQLKTKAGSTSYGAGGIGGSSYSEAGVLEYSIETFYPSRLKSEKPEIKYYEFIDKDAFQEVNREMRSIAASFEQTMKSNENDW